MERPDTILERPDAIPEWPDVISGKPGMIFKRPKVILAIPTAVPETPDIICERSDIAVEKISRAKTCRKYAFPHNQTFVLHLRFQQFPDLLFYLGAEEQYKSMGKAMETPRTSIAQALR